MQSIYDALLVGGAKKYGGGKTIILYEGKGYDYKSLIQLAERQAKQLANRGIRAGDAVVLALPDSVELFTLFYGLIKLGAKPLCVSNRNCINGLLDYVKASAAAALILDASNNDLIGQLAGRECGVHIFSLDLACALAPLTEVARTHRPLAQPVRDESVQFLTSTSGSSGEPKIIPNGLSAVLETICRFSVGVLQITQSDIILSSSKLSYTYALVNNMLTPVACGAAAILFRENTALSVLYDLASSHHPTLFASVPAVYNCILRDKAGIMDVSAVRMFVSSGDVLPLSVSQAWRERFGADIVDCVGCSETCAAFLVNKPPHYKAGSAGRAVDGFSLKLMTENGLSASQKGVLWVRGERASKRYLHSPAASMDKFRDGWVVTGDVFTLDDEGFYWFEGRSDELIKHNGLWISTLEVRDKLLQHSLVSEAEVLKVCIGGLECLAAVVVLRCADPDYANTLCAYLQANLSKYKCPKLIREVKAIPRNLNGKVDKKSLIKELSGA